MECADDHFQAEFVRVRASGPHWYGKWYRDGRPVIRALGRAWVEPDGAGGWRPRRGRRAQGALTEAEAGARLLEVMHEHHAGQLTLEADEAERRRRGMTFRELSAEWMVYLQQEKGLKPSSLRDYRWVLAEPGQPHRRGAGRSPGLMMARFGDRPVMEITSREVAEYLRSLDRAGTQPRSVNKHRQVLSAIFSYGMREDTYHLAKNPVSATSKRREPPQAAWTSMSRTRLRPSLAWQSAADTARLRSSPTTTKSNAHARSRIDRMLP